MTLLAFASIDLSGCAAQAHTIVPPVESSLVQLEVYDRADRTTLPVYSKDGRRYIVGTPGHEYSVRIRNRTGGRVLVVTSVDGVNVISGDTADPSQSGYVLDPWGSVEIRGWRKSLQRTAAFFFTSHENSYAARTGRPDNVGVIGVAAFREKAQPIARAEPAPMYRERADARPAPAAPMTAQPAEGANADMAKAESRLGTGHGRHETSPVRLVQFERASDTPNETVAVQYDRRANLVALGVLPPAPHITRSDPQAFPGMRFAPDPR